MIRQNHQPLTPRDYWQMLFRHRIRCFAFFVCIVGLTVAGILVTPRKYQSEAKLYVKENLRIDPTATDEGQPYGYDREREAEMRSVLAMLNNRSLYRQVIDQLGTGVVLESDLGSSPMDAVTGFFASFSEQPAGDAAEIEKAIRKLNKTIEIEHPKSSHVIVLTYTSQSAERAERILQIYVDSCLKQHLEVNTNPESYAFFEKQESLVQQRVMEAKSQLRDAKNVVGLISVGSQRHLLEEYITNLDRSILTTRTDLAAWEEKIQKLRAQLPFEMQTPAATTSMSIRAIDEMRNQLFTSEVQYRRLQALYQANHPKIIALQEQVKESQLLLNQQQLLVALSDSDSLKSRERALLADREVTKQKLVSLNEDEVRIAELERRVEDLTANHRLYAKKLEQARLDEGLESDHITNLRLAQAPTRMGKPISRGGLLILAAAALLGVIGSVGLAYISEYIGESSDEIVEHEGRPGALARHPRHDVAYVSGPSS